MVRVQDTPGYGEDENIQVHIDMILDYITRQNRRWLAAESARDRQVDMAEVDDPRVDVCIYCLPPHRCARNWLLACCRLLAACACCLCLLPLLDAVGLSGG